MDIWNFIAEIFRARWVYRWFMRSARTRPTLQRRYHHQQRRQRFKQRPRFRQLQSRLVCLLLLNNLIQRLKVWFLFSSLEHKISDIKHSCNSTQVIMTKNNTIHPISYIFERPNSVLYLCISCVGSYPYNYVFNMNVSVLKSNRCTLVQMVVPVPPKGQWSEVGW